MAAPLHSSDPRAELARLRRRAYGPDADIANDPTAVARLAELESVTSFPAGDERARKATDPAVASRDVPAGAVVPQSQRGRGSARPLLIVAIAAVGVAVGATAAVAVGAVTAPRPDVTLQAAAIISDEDLPIDGGWLDTLGIPADNMRAFDEYRGFSAWAGEASDGLTCLFVTDPDQQLVTYSCTAPSVPPVADFQIGNGTVSLGGGPRGIVRFELRDGVVAVYDRLVPRQLAPSYRR